MSPKTANRKEQKAATREQLKEAARRCFSKLGYEETTMARLAEAAGVAHGTFYVHFKNKEAVLDELLVEFNEEMARRLRPVLSEPGDLRSTIGRIAATVLDYWSEGRWFLECTARRMAGDLTIGRLRDGINPPMAGLLRQVLDIRLGAGAKTELLVQALLAVWLRIGLHALFNDEVSRQDAIETLTRVTLAVLAADPEKEE